MRRLEILLIFLFFIFSFWLVDKSFGYDAAKSEFRVARHQVGDFGLHLSLIRSFSWGDNVPPQSPFFPRKPLPYHYYFDLLVGLFERAGVRIDVALNSLSAIFLTILLFMIYKLPQVIFKKSVVLGLLSVALFLFHSNLTFIDFIKEKGLSARLFHDLWFLPDYVNKGPFDGSTISIFFTLNVFLNQRHLIAALAISLGILYFFLERVINSREISVKSLLLIGLILGITSRFHTLVFFSSSLIILLLIFLFKRFRFILPFFFPVFVVASFHFKDIIAQDLTHQIINLGFLSQKPLTLASFSSFWFLNLGVAAFLIPLGFLLSPTVPKKVFLSIVPLFILGNIFQASFRIEHNHSLFNYFLIMANFYIAYALIRLWQLKILGKIFTVGLFFLLTVSGFIDLMAVKNDFQYRFADAPTNSFMQWAKDNTTWRDIFLAREEILDPVTLSGRRNYLGHDYYLSIMGYNFSQRKVKVKTFFEADKKEVLEKAQEEGIKYMAIPKKPVPNFHYNVNMKFLRENLKIAFQDEDLLVFKL